MKPRTKNKTTENKNNKKKGKDKDTHPRKRKLAKSSTANRSPRTSSLGSKGKTQPRQGLTLQFVVTASQCCPMRSEQDGNNHSAGKPEWLSPFLVLRPLYSEKRNGPQIDFCLCGILKSD